MNLSADEQSAVADSRPASAGGRKTVVKPKSDSEACNAKNYLASDGVQASQKSGRKRGGWFKGLFGGDDEAVPDREVENESRSDESAFEGRQQDADGNQLQDEADGSSTVAYDNNPTIVKRPERKATLIRRRTGERLPVNCPVVFGRGSAATELISGNRLIGRVHLRIFEDDQGFIAENCSQTNGTWVDGCKLDRGQTCRLSNGSDIVLADEGFVFQIEGGTLAFTVMKKEVNRAHGRGDTQFFPKYQ